jgi:4-hydroxy-tetrahydrodipicolinate synthase
MDYHPSDAKSAARERFIGLWAAVTTPFDAEGNLDEAGLRQDLRRLIDDLEIDGVFCTGVMSEFWALSDDERRRSVEVVVDECRGRCPVIAHTGHHSVQQTIALTHHATEAGADFAVVINPYYPPASESALYAWFETVCRSVDIGLWLFDTSYSGVSLSTELVSRLADLTNVCGIKVGHDHARYLEMLRRVGDRILVCEPSEGTWLEDMRDHGQRVFMSSAAPYLYQTPGRCAMREYTRLALAGDIEAATRVAATLDPVRKLSEKWVHGKWARERVNPVPYIKVWSGLLGMSGGKVRPPLDQVTDAEHRAMVDDLVAVGLLDPEAARTAVAGA